MLISSLIHHKGTQIASLAMDSTESHNEASLTLKIQNKRPRFFNWSSNLSTEYPTTKRLKFYNEYAFFISFFLGAFAIKTNPWKFGVLD